jgi:hypothetical protein
MVVVCAPARALAGIGTLIVGVTVRSPRVIDVVASDTLSISPHADTPAGGGETG